MRSMFGDWLHSALTQPAERRLQWNASWCRRCWLWRCFWGRSWARSTGERGPACPISPALTLGGDKLFDGLAGSSCSSQSTARNDSVALLTSVAIVVFASTSQGLVSSNFRQSWEQRLSGIFTGVKPIFLVITWSDEHIWRATLGLSKTQSISE